MALSATAPDSLVYLADTPAPPRPVYITAGGRDLRIDLLRGFCVFALIVDHVAGISPLYLITGGTRFFTSGAEGFVFASGLTAGLVYQRLIARNGFTASAAKALRRAFSLYALTVGLTLLVATISEWFNLPWAQALDFSHAVSLVVSVLTLHRTYYLADVMLLYTLLFAVLPAALLLLATGHTRILLTASWLLWLLHQLFPWSATVTWAIAGGGTFKFSAWQVFFFTALAIGYHHDRLPRFSARRLQQLHLVTGLATAAAIAAYFLLRVPADRLPPALLDLGPQWEAFRTQVNAILLDKGDAGPGRLAIFAVMFGFFQLSLTRWWARLNRLLSPLLLPLGQNALYVFTAHAPFTLAAHVGLLWLGWPEDNLWLNTALQLSAVAIIWWMTRRQFLAATPRTRPYWHAVPFGLAVAVVILLQWLPFPPAR